MGDDPETVGDLIRAYLAEQCTVIGENESALRQREPVVHPTRVAARRLRSTLRTYAAAVDPARAGELTDELVWFAGLLGQVRDRDILSARLTADLAELPSELLLGPVAAQLETELTTQLHVAWDGVLSALDSDRYRRLLAELHRWRDDAPLTAVAMAPATKVKKYVKRANKKLDKRLGRAIEAHRAGDADADHLLHQARKAGKRARYATELAAPLLGQQADQVIEQRKDLQDVLGEHQDSIVAGEFLRAEGGRIGIRSGHNGFTYGLLYGRELSRQATIGEQLKPFSS
ncbi:MAG: CHAD domain-containing protein [Microlunatus sp.]|nr:CHAD domain-containing protein [Microlunatus sp.]MDN5805249.1 CHAD domain-containing protein [Microlunatus sp.]